MFHVCPRAGIGLAFAIAWAAKHLALGASHPDSATWAAYAAMREQEYERRVDEQIRLAILAEQRRLAAEAAEDLRLWLQQDVH